MGQKNRPQQHPSPPWFHNLDPKAWSKKVKAKKLEGNSPEPQGSIFWGVGISRQNWKVQGTTPLRINMEHNLGGLFARSFSFLNGWLVGSMLIFQGVKGLNSEWALHFKNLQPSTQLAKGYKGQVLRGAKAQASFFWGGNKRSCGIVKLVDFFWVGNGWNTKQEAFPVTLFSDIRKSDGESWVSILGVTIPSASFPNTTKWNKNGNTQRLWNRCCPVFLWWMLLQWTSGSESYPQQEMRV